MTTLNGGSGLNGSKYNTTYTDDITITGDIDGSSRVSLVSTTGTIVVEGKIDGSSMVTLVSNMGSVLLFDKIDGSSDVTLIAENGKVAIGPEITFGGHNDDIGKIDGSSQVYVRATEYIFTNGRIDGSSNVIFKGGEVSILEAGLMVEQLLDYKQILASFTFTIK
ncbi:hypothetical protein [Dictyobacter kobayashii]|uniref:Uncharacterized protein n=1 Tax=Dictyobacter kobayashii TaxID=2014872 RepID=A0A402AEP3_9CHLR|nr:hypothetical protein [Dictyobacter kobayashii]GCE17556.1 hypothetical protein KDK_13560 [Dictyobacter kobayashii]